MVKIASQAGATFFVSFYPALFALALFPGFVGDVRPLYEQAE